jgi:hypothetical protein
MDAVPTIGILSNISLKLYHYEDGRTFGYLAAWSSYRTSSFLLTTSDFILCKLRDVPVNGDPRSDKFTLSKRDIDDYQRFNSPTVLAGLAPALTQLVKLRREQVKREKSSIENDDD